jgi:hypothetical protein
MHNLLRVQPLHSHCHLTRHGQEVQARDKLPRPHFGINLRPGRPALHAIHQLTDGWLPVARFSCK